MQLDPTSPAWCLRLMSELSAADERATLLIVGMTSAGSANPAEDIQEIPTLDAGHVDAIQVVDLAENPLRSNSSTPTKPVTLDSSGIRESPGLEIEDNDMNCSASRLASVRGLASRPCQAGRKRERLKAGSQAVSWRGESVRLDQQPAPTEGANLLDIGGRCTAALILDFSTNQRRKDELA
jgi:hypothetical protein